MLQKGIIYSFIIMISGSLAVQAASVTTNADITQRLDRIERLMKSQGLLDMLQQLEKLQLDTNRLRGEIEIQNHTLEKLKSRQRDLYADVDQRLQSVESPSTGSTKQAMPILNVPSENPPLETLSALSQEPASLSVQQAETSLTVETVEQNQIVNTELPEQSMQAMIETSPQTTSADIVSSAVETVSDPIQARADYQQAFKLLKQSLYEQAIKAFQEFLGNNPNSEYSDNAQYWLGEAHYVTRNFEVAIKDYEKLSQIYPDSQKLTHALLKTAYSYQELGQVDTAKTLLEDLKTRFPGTTAARLADDRLKKINAAQLQDSNT